MYYDDKIIDKRGFLLNLQMDKMVLLVGNVAGVSNRVVYGDNGIEDFS